MTDRRLNAYGGLKTWSVLLRVLAYFILGLTALFLVGYLTGVAVQNWRFPQNALAWFIGICSVVGPLLVGVTILSFADVLLAIRNIARHSQQTSLNTQRRSGKYDAP